MTAEGRLPLRFQIPPLPEPLRSDFRAFLVAVWQHLNLPRPTPVQLDMANYLQHGPDRRGIQAFRGIGKSWETAAYVLWKLRNNPLLKFLVTSASKDRADNFTTFILRLILDMPLLQCLSPQDGQRCSKLSFDVGPAPADQAPSVTSKGITSQLSGARANEIISDDVEVPNNALTQTQRDKLAEAVKEYDAIIKPGGIITYLGTPQTELSLYTQLPARGYDIRIWPALFPTPKQVENYGGKLAPSIVTALEKSPQLVGTPTDPRRFSMEDLMARELSYGKAGFALQFMLDTQLSDVDRYPLKLSDLIVMDLSHDEAPEKVVWCSSPEKALADLPCVGLRGDRYYAPMKIWETWQPYTGSVMAIDPSGRGKDETAFAVVKMLNGFLFLTAMDGLQGGYTPEVMLKLATTAKEQKVQKIKVESNFGDGMFVELLKPWLAKVDYPCMIEEVRHSTQKEKRICDTLEPVMGQHRLVVDKTLIQKDFDTVQRTYASSESGHKYQLFYQMARITRDKGALTQDDRLDALVIAVADCVEQMSLDADKSVKQRREEVILDELEVWQRDVEDLPMIGLDLMGSDSRGSWCGRPSPTPAVFQPSGFIMGQW